MFPVHDNEIISYSVDLKNNKIILNTKSDSGKFMDILFTGVMAHYFECELSGSIIYEICKNDIASFMRNCKFYESLLVERKGHCWPTSYKTLEELEEKLTREQFFYYTIEPSYGLGGFVFAKGHEVKNID